MYKFTYWHQSMSQLEQNESSIRAVDQQNQGEPIQGPEIVIHEVQDPEEPQPSIEKQKGPAEAENKKDEDEEAGSPGKDGENQYGEEDDEEEQEKEGEEADQNAKRESSDSNREDNDTSQLQVIGGKKCFNKLCNSKKLYKKIRSKVEIQRYRFLCKNCYDNYVNNSFCQFCEQIYSNYEDQEDDTKWVGCDKCERWNHIECERKYRHKNFEINKDKDTQYECLSCSKKNRNGQAPQDVALEPSKRKVVERDYQGTRNYRAKVEINKEERIPIFHKKPDIFPCLESFLQTYNFRLWLNDANIRQDIESLRSLNRRPVMEEENKKLKKVKQY